MSLVIRIDGLLLYLSKGMVGFFANATIVQSIDVISVSTLERENNQPTDDERRFSCIEQCKIRSYPRFSFHGRGSRIREVSKWGHCIGGDITCQEGSPRRI